MKANTCDLAFVCLRMRDVEIKCLGELSGNSPGELASYHFLAAGHELQVIADSHDFRCAQARIELTYHSGVKADIADFMGNMRDGPFFCKPLCSAIEPRIRSFRFHRCDYRGRRSPVKEVFFDHREIRVE